MFPVGRFKECPVIAVAAKPGGPDAPEAEEPHGVQELIEVQVPRLELPQPQSQGQTFIYNSQLRLKAVMYE